MLRRKDSDSTSPVLPPVTPCPTGSCLLLHAIIGGPGSTAILGGPASTLGGAGFNFDAYHVGRCGADAARGMTGPIRVEHARTMYHVTVRHNEPRVVFRDDEDQRRFDDTLSECRECSGWWYTRVARCLIATIRLPRHPAAIRAVRRTAWRRSMNGRYVVSADRCRCRPGRPARNQVPDRAERLRILGTIVNWSGCWRCLSCVLKSTHSS